MDLIEKLKKDKMASMRDHQSVRKSLLSILIAESINSSMQKSNSKEPSDEIVIATIKKQIASNQEVHGQLGEDRKEAAMILAEEIKIMGEYLPAQMSEEDIGNKISEFLSAVPEEARKKSLGKVMTWLKAEYNGMYDATIASKIAKGKCLV